MNEPTIDPNAVSTDFLVVGAGPVGLVTALLLGRQGWRVDVVERWPSRYPMPRACTIDHEALRILQSAGVMAEHAGLFEPSRGARGGCQIRNADGVLLQAINWNRPAESGWANTNGFYQPDLEAVLESMALAQPTVTLHRGWSATAVEQDETCVTLTVTAAGVQQTSGQQTSEQTSGQQPNASLRAHWLVAADGANSAIRDLVGIATVDTGFEADWLVVDYRPLVDRQWDAFVTQYCDPRQPATAVKSGPGRRRFEFMRRADVSAEELARPESAWTLMAPWGVTPETAVLERSAVYTFRGRWAQGWRRGRVLLAGDAAHLMPPFLGQGLCSGLRDASALGWRLSLIESGLAADSILDSYGAERGTHVREIITEAVAIGRTVCEVDPAAAAERDARMIAELLDPDELTVEPPHPRLGRPSITEADDPNAGRLSVQGTVVAHGTVGLYDDVIGGAWQLIGLDTDPLASASDELRDWFASIGGRSARVSDDGPITDIDGDYQAWFEAHDCALVLSRPDFYIYGTGAPGGAPRLLADLRSALQGTSVLSRQLIEEGALP